MNKLKRVLHKIINTYVIKKHKVEKGNNLRINGRLHIHGNKVKIGDNCVLNSNINYNPIGGSSGVYLVTRDNGMIEIGNNVGISNSTLYSCNSIILEDNVMIGGSCKIYDTDFHSINYEDRIVNKNINIKSKPVLIKEGAWIGGHSIILKGVTIGKHSVIGAGSVVTKDVPDNEVWAGNPAKFIKKVEK